MGNCISEDVTEQKEIETRIYNEESLRKVLNEDIILNIRLNFLVILSKIFLYIQ